MESKFEDANKAACYLKSGLRDDFPEGAFGELLYYGRHVLKPRSAKGEAMALLPMFERLISHFPCIRMTYTPTAKYGLICTAVCECERGVRANCPHHCKYKSDCPRVAIILTRVGEREVMVGVAQPIEKALKPDEYADAPL